MGIGGKGIGGKGIGGKGIGGKGIGGKGQGRWENKSGETRQEKERIGQRIGQRNVKGYFPLLQIVVKKKTGLKNMNRFEKYEPV